MTPAQLLQWIEEFEDATGAVMRWRLTTSPYATGNTATRELANFIADKMNGEIKHFTLADKIKPDDANDEPVSLETAPDAQPLDVGQQFREAARLSDNSGASFEFGGKKWTAPGAIDRS